MIHTGLSANKRNYVIGYAVKIGDSYFIVDSQGIHTEVIKNTIKVYTEGTNIQEPIECREDYGEAGHLKHMHSLKECLNESEYSNFKEYGAYYLEDLQNWTDKDYARVRNVGRVKRRRIKNLLEGAGLKYSGT